MRFLQMNRTTITFITTFFCFHQKRCRIPHSWTNLLQTCNKHKPEKRVNIKSKTTTYVLQITFQTAFKMTKF